MKQSKLFRMTPLLALFLALLMLFSTVSCDRGEVPAETTGGGSEESTSETDATTEEPEAPSVLVATGATVHYSLVRPEDVTEPFFALYNEVAMGLELLTGGSVECDTDLLMYGQTQDPEKLEILFGNCNDPATEEVKHAIGMNDWTVRAVGKKIVIFGHHKDTLKKAADHFLTEMLVTTEDGNLCLAEDYTYSAGETMLFGAENPLSGYRIVYENGNATAKRYSEKLATAIRNRADADLPVVSDAEAETACEILVGSTARLSVADVPEINYCVRVVDRKLVIGMESTFALENGVTAFIQRYLVPSPYSDVFNFAVTHNESSFAYYSENDPALHGDADLRVMSWNMLTELWNDKTPVEVRDEYAAAAIRYYAPDVVGVQEVTPAWYNALEGFLGDEYAFVSKVNQKGTVSYNSLFYNKKTVRVVEHGVTNFSVGASTMRLITWALFERISDGARFIVASTHWDTGSYPDRIATQAKEMAQVVNSLYARYQVPMFCTGDYNRVPSTEQFRSYLQLSGFLDAPSATDDYGLLMKTYHSVLGESPSSGEAIDHITVSPNADVRYYTVIVDAQVLAASDHCPIFVDVALSAN